MRNDHAAVSDPQLPHPPALDLVGMPRHPHRHRLYNRGDECSPASSDRLRPSTSPSRATRPARPSARSCASGSRRWSGERLRIPIVIGGREVETKETTPAVMPHRKDHVLADVAKGGPEHVQQAIDAAREAHERWSRLPWEERASVFLRAAELLAGAVAHDARRGDDAEPVEDRAPGGDRRGLRADRLLALQRRVHVPDLRRAAGVVARGLEPDGVPPARGLRLRRQPVQLHRDRRQPHRLRQL